MGKKLGILGGSFDPLHLGHLSVAQQVADGLGLDQVILVPAGSPPHKLDRELAPAADRLAMVRLAVRGLARLSVSDVEICRPGPSYTIDTLRQMRAALGEGNDYSLIIGADTVGDLPAWHQAARLLEEADFAVVGRPGYEPDFAAVKKALGAPAAARLRAAVVQIEPCEVSSTEIRRRVAAGEDLKGLVRADVAEYIKSRGLYR